MNATQIIARLLPSAAEFLAAKHGVTVAQIADALEAKNEKIAAQLADLMASAYEAHLAAK
jgi:chromosome segregation and condensation protein ScpB